MDRTETGGVGRSHSVRRVAIASLVGTAIEWYDYFIFGTAAALFFGALFFPEEEPLVGTLLAFATFGAGFVARPIGGVIFGHFGDRVGRKSMLVVTLIMMGLSTFLIGLLPTHASIGVWAPVLLVTLRLVQGLSVGGEWGGAVLMAVEHSTRGRRGFYGSFPQLGVPVGFLLSTVAFLLVNLALSQEQVLAWGWRLPFLFSILLVAVGLFIRLKIEESPLFRQVRETRSEARMPIMDVLRNYPKQVALAVGASLGFQVVGYVVLAYLLSYGTQVLGLPNTTLLLFVGIAAIIAMPAILYFSALSDRIGRRKVFLAGAAAAAIMSFPFFWLLDTRSLVLVFIAVVVTGTVQQAMAGPAAALFSEMFGTRTRYSGASLGYQLGAIAGGGFAPFIATALYAATGTSLSISVYMFVACAITFACVLFITETYQRDLAEEGDGLDGRIPDAPAARERGPAVG